MTPVEALERIAELLMRGRAPSYRQQAFRKAAREVSRIPDDELRSLAESGRLTDIPGVGEKTAAALVSKFGTAEAILAAARSGKDDGFPAGARAKVLAAADYLDRAPAVVRVVCDIDLPKVDDRLPAKPRDPERLLELSDRWSLEGALNRVLNALQATA